MDGLTAILTTVQEIADHTTGLHEARGAFFLYQVQSLPLPLIATIFDADGAPVVTMVGTEITLHNESLAKLERIVGNPARPPAFRHFAQLDQRWNEVVRARGLTRTITYIDLVDRKVQRLATRYGWTPYAEDADWRWYVREEL